MLTYFISKDTFILLISYKDDDIDDFLISILLYNTISIIYRKKGGK